MGAKLGINSLSTNTWNAGSNHFAIKRPVIEDFCTASEAS
jgi:hypothetical protein